MEHDRLEEVIATARYNHPAKQVTGALKLTCGELAEVVEYKSEVDRLRGVVEQLSRLLLVTPADVDAVMAENDKLRQRETHHHNLARQAIDTMRNAGDLQIRGSFCNYCKEAFTTLDGITPDQCAEHMREHDKTCTANPMRNALSIALSWWDSHLRGLEKNLHGGDSGTRSERALYDDAKKLVAP